MQPVIASTANQPSTAQTKKNEGQAPITLILTGKCRGYEVYLFSAPEIILFSKTSTVVVVVVAAVVDVGPPGWMAARIVVAHVSLFYLSVVWFV